MSARLIILSLCLLVACGDLSSESPAPSSSASPSSSEGAWSHGNQLAFDGRTRTYSIYAPTTGQSLGLMVVLHGSGQRVDDIITALQVETSADERDLIIAVPAGIDEGWNDEDPPGGELADDVGFIDALVTELKALYPSLPAHKVFAHGFSNGGGLATRLACESTQVRGVGVVGNYYEGAFNACQSERESPVPGWFGIGVEDEVVPLASVRAAIPSYVTDLTTCSGTGSLETIAVEGLSDDVVCKQLPDCDQVRLCEYTNRGHELLPASLESAWRFLSEAVELEAN